MQRLLSRTASSSWCRLGKEGAILNKELGMYFHLNETGAKIWEALNEPREVGSLCTVLKDTFDVPVETAQKDVLAFAEALVAAKLAEWTQA